MTILQLVQENWTRFLRLQGQTLTIELTPHK